MWTPHHVLLWGPIPGLRMVLVAYLANSPTCYAHIALAVKLCWGIYQWVRRGTGGRRASILRTVWAVQLGRTCCVTACKHRETGIWSRYSGCCVRLNFCMLSHHLHAA